MRTVHGGKRDGERVDERKNDGKRRENDMEGDEMER